MVWETTPTTGRALNEHATQLADLLQAHASLTRQELGELGFEVKRLNRVVRNDPDRFVLAGGRYALRGNREEAPGPTGGEWIGEYVVFDLETTSADPETADILEIAALRVRGGEEVDRFEALLHGTVPREVARLTGLTQELLEREGEAGEAVLPRFLEWSAGLPLLAHNAEFDRAVLRRALENLGLSLGGRTVLDSLALAPLAFARRSDPPQAFSLEGLHHYLTGAAHGDAHRALHDCRATLRVVQAAVRDLSAMEDGPLRQLLVRLPVPEFRLVWSREACSENFPEIVNAALSVAAERAEVRSGGRVPQRWAEMLPSPRPGQVRMLGAVEATLQGGGVAMIEAPTGTGKTRGYLIPALLQGRPGAPVVISTHTRQLQEQVLAEARALAQDGAALHVIALKGQHNYLCPDRLGRWLQGRWNEAEARLDLTPAEARAAAALLLHLHLGEFGKMPASPVRRGGAAHRLEHSVGAVRSRCSKDCAFHQQCAFYPLHQARERAQVVVVNHAMLFRQLLEHEDETLPLRRVVVDEAHDLVEAAQSALRRESGVQPLRALLAELLDRRPRRHGEAGEAALRELRELFGGMAGAPDLKVDTLTAAAARLDGWLARQQELPDGFERRLAAWRSGALQERGLLPALAAEALRQRQYRALRTLDGLRAVVETLRHDLEAWHARLLPFAMQHGQGDPQFGFTAAVVPALAGGEFQAVRRAGEAVHGGLRDAEWSLKEFVRLGHAPEAESFVRRLSLERETLQGLLGRDPGSDIYAVTASKEDGALWSLPLWLSGALKERWKAVPSLVLTSATLRIPGGKEGEGEGDVDGFGLFQSELGLPPARFVQLPPTLPYHLGEVVLAPHLPLVRQPGFADLAGQELAGLAPQLPGRSLHIFTANARQKEASARLRGQGVAHLASARDGAERVVRDLQKHPQGVALGSAGFMQGVDIRDLSMVSLDRLPFPVPDVIMAQQRLALGSFDAFWDTIYLPRAVLKFVQAFGRLVRDDRVTAGRGAFVLWDRRLAHSAYQGQFLGALPVPAANVHRPDTREDFYGALSGLFGPLNMGELRRPKDEAAARLAERVGETPPPEWGPLIEEGLQTLFELQGARLRPGQLEGMSAALQGRDLLTVLPTGGGKSVVFQLPALLQPGYTLVVSPLVSLMQDQVGRLQMLGLPGAGLWGGLSRGEALVHLQEAREGRLKLLYVSPERVTRSEELRELLRHNPPARVVYDEAHCLLEWGHDFRPDYGKVPAALRDLGVECPASAFTATATPGAQRSLVEQLLQDPVRWVGDHSRENLHHRVIPVKAGARDQQLVDVVSGVLRGGGAGRAIVYAGSRAKTERLAALLSEVGLSAEAYHAGLSPAIRADLVERFAERSVQAMVATNAFGMGIDVPDVRLVVHYDVPLSLEAYVQEAGRAGRDGQEAHAVLLLSGKPRVRAANLLRGSYPSADEARGLLAQIARREYPTERELAEELDTAQLNTTLHLLQESGALQWSWVPGLYRVFALYGVRPPADPELAELLGNEPVHLSRRFGVERAVAVQERLHKHARRGELGVIPLAPALHFSAWSQDLGEYERRCRALSKAKLALFGHMETFLDGPVCREAALRAYFGGSAQGNCGRCDRCAPNASLPWSGVNTDLKNIWNVEREVLRMLTHLQRGPSAQGRGRGTLSRLLQGEEFKAPGKPMTPFEVAAPGYGLLRYVERDHIDRELGRMVQAGLLHEAKHGEYTTLELSERGKQEAGKWTRA